MLARGIRGGRSLAVPMQGARLSAPGTGKAAAASLCLLLSLVWPGEAEHRTALAHPDHPAQMSSKAGYLIFNYRCNSAAEALNKLLSLPFFSSSREKLQ